ncbi:putative ribonuclease H-like domain-containing protein [Tanacetum coccineum]
MTRKTRSYPSQIYEEIVWIVAFGGNSKGGKITGKGKIRIGKLDFEDLTNKNHVLLKLPRKDNMYSVDLRNIVPQRGLTCLFAKAISDESNLWHKRMGHINFKTMNKLVRRNLKTTEDPAKEDDKDDQDLREFKSSPVNTVGTKDADMPNLEDTSIFGGACDDEDFLAGEDMNNLESSMPDSPITITRECIIPNTRIEAIRLFLAYASFKDFVVYRMDVKSAFMYGKIKEEVYVCQPPGLEDPEFPDRVYKVEKALYGLHQAPRAWYETLSTNLLENRFQRGQIDKTLFIKRVKSDILLVQVYVDDIIFGSTKKKLCTEFEKLMHKKFQMSSMGELTFFLGLQVT